MARFDWLLGMVLVAGCASGSVKDDDDGDGAENAPDEPTEPGSVELPRLSVTVDEGLDPDDEPDGRDWMPADLDVIENGVVVHEGRAGIHVRGNSTRGYEKKSYALETWDSEDNDADVALLGLPAEEDWVLQGPYSDKTLIRNHLAYTLYRDLGRYAARTRFVEVEVNGDYRGVYVFMEKIKRDDNRVDLPEGAALLKRDWVEGGPEFIETAQCEDVIKVDWPDSAEGILPRLNAVESALLSGDHSQVDLESFVDHMLLVELGRNVDGYVLSTWLTLSEDDVLGMGPVWDYNGALGNADYFESWDPEGWHYENFPSFLQTTPGASAGTSRCCRTRRSLNSARRVGARIVPVRGRTRPSRPASTRQWRWLDRPWTPTSPGGRFLASMSGRTMRGHADRNSHAEEVAYLKSWLEQRARWLDDEL